MFSHHRRGPVSHREMLPGSDFVRGSTGSSRLCEAMRSSAGKITAHSMLSRARAGIMGRTLIGKFTGSPKAAIENFDVIQPVLAHLFQLLLDDLVQKRS